MTRYVNSLVLLLVLDASGARAAEPPRDLLVAATGYLSAREATMQAGATPADVDKALSFCLPSLAYEHPRVGIKLAGTDRIRAGMLDFLGASRNASIKVTASLPGADVLAVQTDVAFEVKEADTWRPVQRKQVWVFEFEGGKVKRIIEYW